MSSAPTHAELARRAVAHWDLDVAGLEFVAASENVTYRVTDTAGRAFVLRLHRPGYHTLAELESEQVWTAALRDAGIDAPVPVPTRAGERYAALQLGARTRYAGLIEWVDGRPLDVEIRQRGGAFARRAYQRLGELMASMHDQATAWRVPPGFRRRSLDAEGLAGDRPFWGPFWNAPFLTTDERTRFSILRRRVYAVLRNLPQSGRGWSLIHADLHPANLIVDGERLHVIDFDDSGFGFHGYDIAAAAEREGAELQALLDGYRPIRDPGEQLDLVGFFLLVRRLAYVGWLGQRPEHVSSRPAALIDTIEGGAGRALAPLERGYSRSFSL